MPKIRSALVACLFLLILPCLQAEASDDFSREMDRVNRLTSLDLPKVSLGSTLPSVETPPVVVQAPVVVQEPAEISISSD